MPLSILLIPFFIFLIAFAVFALSAIFHIIRFELLNIVTILMTLIFGIGTFFIASMSYSYMTKINWQEQITLTPFEGISTQSVNENSTDNILTF